jgi:hypothetical protein
MGYKTTGSNIINTLGRFRLKKRKFDPDILVIEDLDIPIVIKELDEDRLLRDMRSEAKHYKLLGYRFKKKSELENMKEYHSMQIGILLRAIHDKIDLKLNESLENIFPPFVIKHHYGTIQMMVQDIIKKYERGVNKISTEQQLFNETIWTPIEAACLIYYLSFYWKKDLDD